MVYQDLSKLFDERNIPFFLKTLAHPKMYFRCDSCVVYIHSKDLKVATELIRDCIEENKVKLTGAVPLMTLKIMDGVGIADEPSDLPEEGLSFGQWVSSLLVSNSCGVNNPDDIAQKVNDSIVSLGRNPDYPFFRAGRCIDVGALLI